MTNWEGVFGLLGSAAKVLGVLTAIGGGWVSLGLPMPATIAYVDSKIAQVVAAVGDVKMTVLEGQLRDINSQRALLRNERGAIERTVEKAPDTTKLVLTRRLGDIDDTLARLTREEATVSTKLNEGKK